MHSTHIHQLHLCACSSRAWRQQATTQPTLYTAQFQLTAARRRSRDSVSDGISPAGRGDGAGRQAERQEESARFRSRSAAAVFRSRSTAAVQQAPSRRQPCHRGAAHGKPQESPGPQGDAPRALAASSAVWGTLASRQRPAWASSAWGVGRCAVPEAVARGSCAGPECKASMPCDERRQANHLNRPSTQPLQPTAAPPPPTLGVLVGPLGLVIHRLPQI